MHLGVVFVIIIVFLVLVLMYDSDMYFVMMLLFCIEV